MKEEYKDIFELKTLLWDLRLSEIKGLKSSPWKMSNLQKILEGLKNKQSRDPSGLVSELFKPGVIGPDLAVGLLDLINGIKHNLFIPENLKLANITTIYKSRGSRQELSNDRGIFILPIVRKLVDQLIYRDKYDEVDNFMSDSNIGARRKRNIRNHLFVIYGIINSVIQGEAGCIDIQIYDIIQAFDALWLDDCLNDIYDALPVDKRDDKLALLYEINKHNKVAVNTAVGQTERVDIHKVVTQGGTWGSLLCSNHIDTIGRRCTDTGEYMYKYKGHVEVMPLAMVDDLLGIAAC